MQASTNSSEKNAPALAEVLKKAAEPCLSELAHLINIELLLRG